MTCLCNVIWMMYNTDNLAPRSLSSPYVMMVTDGIMSGVYRSLRPIKQTPTPQPPRHMPNKNCWWYGTTVYISIVDMIPIQLGNTNRTAYKYLTESHLWYVYCVSLIPIHANKMEAICLTTRTTHPQNVYRCSILWKSQLYVNYILNFSRS